jgi:hypothetical protein
MMPRANLLFLADALPRKLIGRHSPIWYAVAFSHEVTDRCSAAHLLDQRVVSIVFLMVQWRQRKQRRLANRAYRIGREPVMRMSTSLLALCCQSGPDATWETPISARSRSNGSRSLRMSRLLMARFTSASIAP